MKFLSLVLESTLQINDRTRLDATKGFLTPDEGVVTKVEIQPSAADSFYEVSHTDPTDQSLWYLDWQYATAGMKAVVVKVTNSGGSTTFTKSTTVIASTTDYLFSSDDMLTALEPDIMNWVPPGRNSFLNVHREAQAQILEYLDREGYADINGNAFTKAALVRVSEVAPWSKYLTLKLIFQGIKNAKDDEFLEKVQAYEKLEVSARSRAILRIDIDGDGAVDQREGMNITSGTVFRR